MGRFNPEDTIVPSEMYSNPTRFYNNLRKLAYIVLHQYYSYVHDKSVQEDLVAEAIMKAVDLCSSNTFDSSKSSLRNYLFTGMRNQMQNYMYKQRKLVLVDELRYTEETASYQEDTEPVMIDEDLVYDICDKFYRIGEYHNVLIKRLKDYGIVGEFTDLEPPEEIDSHVLDAMFAEYIWRYL